MRQSAKGYRQQHLVRVMHTREEVHRKLRSYSPPPRIITDAELAFYELSFKSSKVYVGLDVVLTPSYPYAQQ